MDATAPLSPSTPPAEWLTREEAAALLGISERTVRRRIADGTIPARRIGRLLRIPRAAILADDLGAPVGLAAYEERRRGGAR